MTMFSQPGRIKRHFSQYERDESKLFADMYTLVAEAHRILVQCEKDGAKPSRWVEFYSHHVSSLLHKLQLEREEHEGTFFVKDARGKKKSTFIPK